MDWLLEKSLHYPRQAAVLGGLIILVCTATAWWYLIWMNPQRVFEDMLTGNLSTTSVTKAVSLRGNGQSLDQFARLEMGGADATHWLVTAKQAGSAASTESIGTPDAGYVRYVNIAQSKAAGKALDFSNVLSVWARSDGKADTSLDSLFSQTVLDIMDAPTPPIANLPTSQRDQVVDFMRDEQVFAPDYSNVKHETINGRAAYTYLVKVKMQAYVRMMQAFAHDLGLHSLDAIDPGQYATSTPVIAMSVDPASHELVRLNFASSGFIQTYTDWGLLTPITMPAKTITATELQDRLQTLTTIPR